MKLSIIVPVFNEEKTIQDVIERVSAVVIPNVSKELIIVDDGSTDRTYLHAERAVDKINKEKKKLDS